MGLSPVVGWEFFHYTIWRGMEWELYIEFPAFGLWVCTQNDTLHKSVGFTKGLRNVDRGKV